jgi:flagellar biosynthesis/type III secretory pathway protein FliH
MVDERIMTRFDKMRIEFDKMKIAIKAEARAEGIAEGRVEGIAEGRAEGIAEGRVEGIAEGRVEGIAEGRAEGIAEGMVKVARNLLNAGVSKEIIVQTTGLTIADIEKQATIAASASPAAGN